MQKDYVIYAEPSNLYIMNYLELGMFLKYVEIQNK